jgi:hypothetical protein
MAWWCGSPTPSSATSARNTAQANYGIRTPARAPSPTAGSIGAWQRRSAISSIFSGDTTEPRRSNGTRPMSKSGSNGAPPITGFSTVIWSAIAIWRATPSPWRISLPGQPCTGISRWISTVPRFRMWKPGTRGFANARPIGSMSCCPSAISTVVSPSVTDTPRRRQGRSRARASFLIVSQAAAT